MSNVQDLDKVAGWLASAESAVAFTGAGISTESGIPDFRSPGGVWSKNQPVMFQEFLASPAARHEYWRQKSLAHRDFADAAPNAGHRALAKWEEQGRLWGVITQNIDGLHQAAGSQNVLELHGTARAVECLDCHRRYDPEPLVARFLETDDVPECAECGGMLKHATVSFGQQLPEDVLTEAAERAGQCDLFFAIGSSLVVEPAAGLPRQARRGDARLVIINRDETCQDGLADVVLHTSIGDTLTEIDRLLTAD